MHPAAEGLAGSLLYEGYALYPYTPGTAKNSTPTPFGIVYPPAYAAGNASTHDHAQIECVVDAGAGEGVQVEGRALFLVSAGPRHQAAQHRAEIEPVALASLACEPVETRFERGTVEGRLLLSAAPLEGGGARLTLRIENLTTVSELVAAAMDRPEALRHSLLSVQLLAGVSDGRFVSPLERDGALGEAVAGCRNSNSWPVLAAPGDGAVLGAPFILPDHPEVAPESRMDLFDNTEIEEALLLHVHALSDSEREAAASQDPAVAEMIERAIATNPEDVMALHGRLQLREPGGAQGGHPVPGEDEVAVAGVTLRRGGKVVLRPNGRDAHDTMLAGRVATIERIFVGYDDEARIGVTVDDDPARELFSETGRYLFFRPEELEPR